MVSTALLSSLLVISLSGILAQNAGMVPFVLEVRDNQPNSNIMMYPAQAAFSGSLFGAMTRLNNSDSQFNFTFTRNIDFGAFLESVNGLFGNNNFWELLVQTANKTIIRADVGISCFIPKVNETVILNYTTTRQTETTSGPITSLAHCHWESIGLISLVAILVLNTG